ncbi:hypothetical protein HBO01_03330 [Pseudomonas rhodesiae]|uniref:hypothetical protein n=1 Tax=Pseudomonas rhodesiae TaxID=76760 RepID=UPI001474F6EF|nr:hypothetical protein [Pseudomonas rhodesiae]NMY77708.1 hypothetical protein [Pseudomonas rhodesiae]
MADYTELKRLAEACGDLNWRAIQENWCEWAIRDDHGYIAVMRTKSAKHAGPCSNREAKAKFLCAMTPDAVLALIAENDSQRKYLQNLRTDNAQLLYALKQEEQSYLVLRAERDQLKAENEALRRELEECAATLPGVTYMDLPDGGAPTIAKQLSRMAKDAGRYRWLRMASHFDTPQHQVFCKAYGDALDEEIDAAMGKGEQS